jgi:hypothetical protein
MFILVVQMEIRFYDGLAGIRFPAANHEHPSL